MRPPRTDFTDPHGLGEDDDLEACEDLPGSEQYSHEEQYDAPETSPDLDPDRRSRQAPGISPGPSPSSEDINCDEVAGPIPTPPGDPNNLDGDDDGLACE